MRLGATQLATFTFDTLGQLSAESRYSSAPGMSYTYDAAGRLSTLAITGASSNSVSWSYSWNPAGEEVSSTRDNDLYAFTGSANVSRAYDPNGLNQYDTVGSDPVSYDADGNLANDNHTAFTYDPQNMLVSASGGNAATLHYDPLGRLFEVSDGTTTTQFLYDGDDLVGEYDGSGTLLDRYVHGVGSGDDPILGYDGSGTADAALRQLYADRLGSVVLTTGYTGTLTGRGAYDDWGIPDAANAGIGASGEGRFQYTGQAWVPEVGLFHYKARMYSPVLGRFMQTDPIGYGDGLNMYRYVGNNPANGVDPDGLEAMCGSHWDPAPIVVCGGRGIVGGGGGDVYIPPSFPTGLPSLENMCKDRERWIGTVSALSWVCGGGVAQLWPAPIAASTTAPQKEKPLDQCIVNFLGSVEPSVDWGGVRLTNGGNIPGNYTTWSQSEIAVPSDQFANPSYYTLFHEFGHVHAYKMNRLSKGSYVIDAINTLVTHPFGRTGEKSFHVSMESEKFANQYRKYLLTRYNAAGMPCGKLP